MGAMWKGEGEGLWEVGNGMAERVWGIHADLGRLCQSAKAGWGVGWLRSSSRGGTKAEQLRI
eukprot:4556566-Alexandrium_andersonii.AAC.1